MAMLALPCSEAALTILMCEPLLYPPPLARMIVEYSHMMLVEDNPEEDDAKIACHHCNVIPAESRDRLLFRWYGGSTKGEIRVAPHFGLPGRDASICIFASRVSHLDVDTIFFQYHTTSPISWSFFDMEDHWQDRPTEEITRLAEYAVTKRHDFCWQGKFSSINNTSNHLFLLANRLQP